MKKLILSFFVFIMIFSFIGCGKAFSDSQKTTQGDTAQVLENKELSDEELAKIVAKSLGVPNKTSIKYDVSETFYWEAAERYFKNVTFAENGESVAYASVDPLSGELLRNIHNYDSPN